MTDGKRYIYIYRERERERERETLLYNKERLNNKEYLNAAYCRALYKFSLKNPFIK